VLAAVSGTAGAVAWRVRRFGRWTARWLAPLVVAVAAPPNRARRPWLGLVRPIAAACVLALVIGVLTALPTGVVMAGSVKAAGKGLPDLADLRPLDQPERTEVYDVNGKLIEVLKSEQDRIVVPLAAVPVMVQNAVVAAEDARFYDHHGVDQRGILRALFTDIAEGARAQGGSTITQQLVRNAYPQLKEQSLARKVREAALAAELERRTSKPKILEQYLNRVYFGGGYYGIEAASRGYFFRRVGQLSLAQAATLAGIIRSPETGNPRSSPQEALRLRNTVLDRMVELSLVPADQAERARRQPLGVQKRKPLPNGRYRWFMDGVKQQLLEDPRLGRSREEREKKLYEGGLRVFTTLNPKIQQDAERAVREKGPPGGPDVALVAMIPSTGAVRAVVGGRDRVHGRFNLALQGHRQAGSAFKPFVLASALENGISPDSVWETSGWPARMVCGAPWKVNNYEGKGGGLLPVRVATWLSVNGVFGRLMEQLCPKKVVDMARRLGVRVDHEQENAPSIALGSANVYPVDMAAAYATFANMGVYQKPNFVTKVVRHGQMLFENTPAGEARVPPALAYEVNDVLKGVIDHGTAVAARIGRPAAGKTGTTQEYRDAWFVGYTPQLATAVWMGYTREEFSMRNIAGFSTVTGGSLPARIWHDFMQEALADTEPADWERPQEGLQYTVLPPPPPPTTQTTIPGQPPGTTVPGQTTPPTGPPTTVVERAPAKPRRLAGKDGGHGHGQQQKK
jgi:penicillin-binding protein 1A